MGIIFRARGINSLALLLIRLAAGGYCVGLGMLHIGNVQNYINKIKSFGIFSENTSTILGFAEPVLMIVFGSLLIIGFFTGPSSFILSLLFLAKIFIIGIYPSPGSIPFTYNIILLACTLAILFAGAGVISFDALIDRKKKVIKDVKAPPQPPPPPPPVNRGDVTDATVIEEKRIEKDDGKTVVKEEDKKVVRDDGKTEVREEKKDINTNNESAP